MTSHFKGMKLFGIGACHPRVAQPDDYRLDPPQDLALVTSGMGAFDEQARTAAVLALWSIASEVQSRNDEDALARGALRAHEALQRITVGWEGLIRPTAMVAAVHLRGSTARIAHAGRCRVSRVGARGLETLTRDHDLARAAAESTAPLTTPLTPELSRIVTRALGGTSDLEMRDLPLSLGDELLLTTPGLHERLTPDVVTEICRRDRPLAARAVHLFDHARARDGSFAFILVRTVEDGLCAEPTGRSSPPLKSYYFAPGEPLSPAPEGRYRGPDKLWFQEIANPLVHGGKDPLETELDMLLGVHPKELAILALIRALRWSLQSLAGRLHEVPEPLDAMIRALDRTRTLADWDNAAIAVQQRYSEWAISHLTDWASDQARDRVEGALDCLTEWARFPERAGEELGSVLDDLVYAEGMWDWDELLAEASLSGLGSIPNEYWDMEVVRDKKRLEARRALILALTEVAPEPAAREAQRRSFPGSP